MRVLKPYSPYARIHSFLNVSEANGPGRRAVIWFQGCDRGCEGCCNPHMQPGYGGKFVPLYEILGWIMSARRERIEGVTFTGGEPLVQPGIALALLASVRKLRLSTVLYTGFDDPNHIHNWQARRVWRLSDIVVAGPYRADLPDTERPVGSSNKRLIFNGTRYTHKDLDRWGRSEVLVGRDGKITQTGVMPSLLAGVPGRADLERAF